MPKKEEEGIIIKIKLGPEAKIRDRARRFATSYARLAFCNLAMALLIFVLMLFCKDDIQNYVAGHDNLTGMNTFFNLEYWAQWTIVIGINVWSLSEVTIGLALKTLMQNESANWIKAWLAIHFLDCILAGLVIVTLFYYVALFTKVVLGIFVILAFLYELYFVNTLLQFIKIISRPHAYGDVVYA